MMAFEKYNLIAINCIKQLLLLLGMFFLAVPKGAAAELNKSFHVSIIWSHQHHSAMPSEDVLRKEWPAACRELGMAILNPALFWGQGTIGKFECDKLEKPAGSHDAQLLIKIEDSGKYFKVSIRDRGDGTVVGGVLNLGFVNKSVLALRNEKFRELVVQYILDSLPVAVRLTEENFLKSENAISWEVPTELESVKGVSLPKNILIYQMHWNSRFKLWRSSIVGESRSSEVTLKVAKRLLHQAATEKNKLVLRWNLSEKSQLNFGENSVLWIHNRSGPDAHGRRIMPQIKRAAAQVNKQELDDLLPSANVLENLLKVPLASAYVGARFGLPLFQDSPYGSKTTFIGVLAEVRSGPLDGLRLNADLWPKVTDQFGDKEGDFEASRYIAGWSFRFAPGIKWLPDFVDISPAIGQWSFEIDVPVAVGDEIFLPSFVADQVFSVGAGLGLEWITDVYLVRLWYSQDFGFNADTAVDASGISTRRFGVDGMYDLMKFSIGKSRFTSSVLGFAGLDAVRLNRTSKPLEGSDDLTIVGIEYLQVYSGGGLSISW